MKGRLRSAVPLWFQQVSYAPSRWCWIRVGGPAARSQWLLWFRESAFGRARQNVVGSRKNGLLGTFIDVMSSCYCCVCWFFMRGKSGPGSFLSTVSWCLPGSLSATSCSAYEGGQTADCESLWFRRLKVTLSPGIHPRCPGFQLLPALRTGPLSQQVK